MGGMGYTEVGEVVVVYISLPFVGEQDLQELTSELLFVFGYLETAYVREFLILRYAFFEIKAVEQVLGTPGRKLRLPYRQIDVVQDHYRSRAQGIKSREEIQRRPRMLMVGIDKHQSDFIVAVMVP